jgi:acetate kinase
LKRKIIIAINAGSSSIKATVYALEGDSPSLNGLSNIEESLINSSFEEAANNFLSSLLKEIEGELLVAIAHRLVQGGPKYIEPVKITDEVISDLEEYIIFDQEHLPLALKLIAFCKQSFDQVLQIACFDTAFFRDLPRLAQILPLPQKYQGVDALRRYGFHGLSYSYLQQAFREEAGDDAVNGRVIYAHLGSGASLAATVKGQPVDTTMSFTPASGIIMSSRSGDLDPGLGWYLYQKDGVSPEQFNQMMSTESGLLGVSGLSADMKTLLDNENTNQRAAEAVALFCYRVAQAVGALSSAIGGLDSLIFSGGIGEQSSIIRERVCSKLEFLGIKIDGLRNQNHQFLISADDSRVGVHVLPTDEAYVMASQVIELIQKGGANE